MDTELAQIRGKIKEIISQVASIPIAEIGNDTSLAEGLDLDSLSLLEIAVDVDYAFKLGLPEERLKEIDCVEDAVALVCHRLRELPAQSEVA